MDLGAALPTSAPFASPAHIVRIAKAAEEFGYAALDPMSGCSGRLLTCPNPAGRYLSSQAGHEC